MVARAAAWRGSPRASSKREFDRVLGYLNPSKGDVFYDLGCGYGGPCIWAAPKVKLAVGVEDHYYRYLRAKREVEKSGFSNIKILWDDIESVSYRNATILYSVIYVGFGVIKKIHRESKQRSKVVLYGLPPYPLKSEHLFGHFHRLVTPFEKVKDEEEYVLNYLGGKYSSMRKLMRSLDREQVRDLKAEIEYSDENWKSLKT
jgi:hypothetical protein